MRLSRHGFSFFSAFIAAAALIGCGRSGSSSILGSDSDGLAKGYENEDYVRAPWHESSMVEEPGGAPSAPANPGDILNTGFEGESMDCWNTFPASGVKPAGCGIFKNMGAKLGSNAFHLVEGGIAHGGEKAIQITYAKNETFAGTDVGLNNEESVNIRAWYYFDQGFDFGQGIKIGRLASFNSSTRLMDIDIILEVRSANGTNQCGLSEMKDVGVFFNGAPKGSDWGAVTSPISFQRGRWYNVEYQVVLNTPGSSNGIVRLWVDGVLKAEKTNLRIRGSLSAKFNTAKIGGWYSNGAGGNTCADPSQPSRLYMDDVVIAKSFIGSR